MSGGKDLYSAWLWDEMTEKPTSVFDGTYDECIAYIKVVYKRREEYEKDIAARYDEIPTRLIGPYPRMEVRPYIDPQRLRDMYR